MLVLNVIAWKPIQSIIQHLFVTHQYDYGEGLKYYEESAVQINIQENINIINWLSDKENTLKAH